MTQNFLAWIENLNLFAICQFHEFGWAPFEKVYNAGQVDLGDDGMMDAITLDQLKPLLWESTELWLDNQSGHITGVVNTSPEKGEVKLPMNKCLYHLNEAIPGLPYGRSRHENIRQVWAEAEQLRQRIAQYMKKVAGASGGIGLTAKLAKAAKSLPLVKQGIEGLSKGVSSLGSALAKHTPNVISKPVDLIIGKPARFIGRHSKGAFKPTVGSTAGAGVAEYFHQQDENDNVTPFLTGAGAGIGMSE